ncbi:fimbria/pilus outer membrane usher protein [Citrobacter amalonaticus]|uniref:fimbria/pilus outer membrane usher protein n=1 Tax=Citrobacter amalonaticus TaxID=35703 RepID=UPI001A2AC62F|nr:fimbrial biogenesis outer membrane usher protein [Citrobacter amalonaticus]HDQ2811745.1 fimbrial biogenesis outer membrane usher protein [Citrobacter amalonaticus]
MSTKKDILTSIHLCCFSTFALFASTITYADDVTPVSGEEKLTTPESENESSVAEFDASLLRQEGQNQIDVSRFVYGSNVLPGKYRIDVLVNQNMVSNQEVVFKENEQLKNKTEPCLSPNIIKLVNLNGEKLPFAVRKIVTEPAACTDLAQLIPGATVKFDADRQQLNIDVPQVYLQHTARGNIDPSLWDSGVPALMLGYYMNGYESHYSGMDTSRTFYSSLNAGLNIGKWYLRHNGSYNWDQDIGGHYQSNNTYVQRDIEAVRGHLYLGQYYTSGQMFNTVSYTGAQLATDDRMLPASQRGYAPDIRGVAKTNAKVTVRQSGNILYQTTVPPGAFLIDDLGPTGYGGDLDVTVEEADGSIQQYSVPYSSLAQSLRPGAQQFSATVGKMDDYSTSEKPLFYEVTFMRGITNILTVYTGAQYSQNYQAVLAGGAVGTEAGAVSADVTQAWSHVGGETGDLVGQSYRVSYSKLIDVTNSNITIAAYRYSSSGYMDLQTAVQTRDAVNHDEDPNSVWRSKNQFSVSLNQGLPAGLGNIYISSSMQNYWNSGNGYNTQYQVGYSNSYKWLNYSINASRNKSETGQDQTSWYLTLSMPLWPGHSGSVPYMSMRYNEDSDGQRGEQVNLSGSFGDTNQYGYNVSGSHDNYSGSSGSVSGSWAGSKATLNGSYSTGSGYSSTSAGMSGGVVVHSGGITFSPYNSDSYALIEAKGAEGAEVAGYGGATVDSSGYALSPSLIPYQQNHVAINPEGSDLGVEFENTSQDVVPRAGSVVKVKFNTHTGTPLLIVSTWKGEPLPFGADIMDDENNPVGAVSQGGVIYVKVSKPKGVLTVKWGDDDRTQCRVPYMLDNADPDNDSKNTIQRFTSVCQ